MSRNKNDWSKAYKEGRIGWDTGNPAPPITEYIDQLKDKDLKILIPGAGNAYEAEYLHIKGFSNVYVLDWAQEALDNLQNRYIDFPEANLICQDFFEHKGRYDLVLEYVFFCSLEPSKRKDYAAKIYELLNATGKLVGALFDDPMENIEGPPFGGTKEEYVKYFEPYFDFRVYEMAYNSIKPRAGRELFINFVKK